MKDDEVIAFQARRIVELEVKIAQSRESERQLLEMLRAAGIGVKPVELNPKEAEFLLLYRRATPEGKARIREKAEAVAGKTDLKVNGEPDASYSQPKAREPRMAQDRLEAAGFSELPKAFFKSPSNGKGDQQIMENSLYRFVSGAGDDLVVHIETSDKLELAAKIKSDFIDDLDLIPLFNHQHRIVTPDGQEFRTLHARRWLAKNS